jgi:hypothetical protein
MKTKKVKKVKNLRNNAIKKLKTRRKCRSKNNKMKGGVNIPIADIIKQINNINNTYLNFSNYDIDYTGAKLITEAIKNNKTLTEFDISNNKIGSVGAQYIAEALKINNTIKTLNISNNNIEDIGAQAIKEALEINKTIKKINISENYIKLVKFEKPIKYTSICDVLHNKDKLIVIDVPQKVHKNPVKKILVLKNTLQKLQDYKVKFLCADSGVCLAFGKYSDIIKKYFNNFTSFEYVNPLSYVTLIGTPSGNGFINEIAYIKNEYKSYAILKSSQLIKADNLMYEYKVGMFINYLNTIFPCFLETYGLYKYKSETEWNNFKNNKLNNPQNLQKSLEHINKLDYNIACSESKLLAILIQHLKGVQSLRSFTNNPTFVNNELIMALFQVYIPLCSVRDYFTHYDLHDENVQIFEPKEDYYIEFHYHFTTTDILSNPTVISFKSSYISKILDYGRSYFNFSKTMFPNSKEADNSNSSTVFTQVCNSLKCYCNKKKCCGYDKGFGWLNVPLNNEKKVHYITPIKKNISHDLNVINFIRQEPLIKNNKKYSWFKSIIYLLSHGTKEQEVSGLPNKFNNIKDLAKYLCYLVNNDKINNDTLYSKLTKLGDLHIYVDEFKPMVYEPTINLDHVKQKLHMKKII